MASRTYQNFDLLLEAAGDGFRARVTTSPLGECPSHPFVLPFDATQLENLLLKLDPGRSGTRRSGVDPQTQASMDLGGPLFEAVFDEDVMLAWQRSQDHAREDGDGLRLRLRLTDAPAIAGLPWELLYDRRSNAFIAQSERTPVVRYLEVPQPPRPLAVEGALRILVVISSPTDLPELDTEAEWRRVQDAMADRIAGGTVKLDRLPEPTVQALSAWLRQNDVHILHVIGHGDFDPAVQDGVVYFQDRYGRSTKVSPTVLGPYLRDHDPLRLVLLNACQSARVDTTDPFSGMAQGLVQQDCTAVVAMQFPISDGAATTFTGEFYGALADGFPVDQAATSARKALIAEYAAEWATPVLFLRSPDGQVFEHIVAQPLVTVVPTPPPPVEPEDERRAEESLAAAGPPPAVPQPVPQPVPRPVPQTVARPVPLAAPTPEHRPPWPLLVTAALVVAAVALGGLWWVNRPAPTPLDSLGGGTSGAAVAAGGASTLSGPRISATRLTTGLTIDGDASDWPSGTPTFDSNSLVFGDEPGLAGTWGLAWDDTDLYLVVAVTDPTALQTHGTDTSQLFKGDGVSFEFGTATPENADASLEPGDKHVLLGPSDSSGGRVLSAVNVATGTVFGRGTNSIQGLRAAVSTTDAGYLLEASVPWSTLGNGVAVDTVAPGAQFGMNLNVSDSVPSGARAGELNAMVSNNPARKGNDAPFRSIWGTLTLDG